MEASVLVKIGMVGAGNIGANLARLFVQAGHEVFLSNSRGPDTLADLASDTGAKAASTADAVAGADVVVVAIPVVAIKDLPADLMASAATNALIIDTGNYYPKRDGHLVDIEGGMTESRWVSNHLRHDVVKVFNNIWAGHLVPKSTATGDPSRIALPVAADSAADVQAAIALLDQIGFDGVEAGTIDESWRQQPGTPVYGADADKDGVIKLLAEATDERPEKWRA